jgi:hypothetical protein
MLDNSLTSASFPDGRPLSVFFELVLAHGRFRGWTRLILRTACAIAHGAM